MKAVLVIDDMPKNCHECPLMYWSICGEACKVTRSSVPSEKKPLWCPLKPMPRKKNKDFHPNIVYANGWNDCIDAITGGNEDASEDV